MPTETASWVGQLLGSRYQVTAKLGEGGMGHVYRARDRHLDCDVVIKVPRRAVLEDPEFAARFSREIRSLVRLVHPHVVRALDVGEHDGLPFAVMQYLPGGTLRDRQKAGPDGSFRPCAPGELRSWLGGVAGALDFIHRERHIHRDVKPENILFDAHGHPYLGDFGVAKVLSDKAEAKSKTVLTGSGMVLGTPQYMAPELLLGHAYDGRIDQYALAVTVYELLAGRYPFDGATPTAIFVQHTNQEPPPLGSIVPTVPGPLAAAVRKALAKDPNERFAGCAAFAQAVLEAAGGSAAATTAARAEKMACPRCRKAVLIPAEARGRRVRCPACGEIFQTQKKPGSATPARPTPVVGETGRSEAPRVDTPPAPVVPPAVPPPDPLPVPSPSAGRQRKTDPAPAELQFSAGQRPASARSAKSQPGATGWRRHWPWVAGGAGLLVLGITLLVAFGLGGDKPAPTLVLEINEPGAEVFIDGKPISFPADDEKKPLRIKVAEGKHQIKVTKSDFEAFTRTVTVAAGATETIPVTLEPKVAVARVPKPAEPADPPPRDPEPVATSPKPAEPADLPPRDPTPAEPVRVNEPPREPEKPVRPEKLAVPDAAALAKSAQVIKDLYKAEFAQTRTGDRLNLADKLFQLGLDPKEQPAPRFALLREAGDLAARAGDALRALKAVDELGYVFAINAPELKAAALELAAGSAQGQAAHEALVKGALEVVNEAVEVDAYPVADRALQVAKKAVTHTKNAVLASRLQTQTAEAEATHRAFKAIGPAADVLEKNPQEPAASAAVGRFRCVFKGEWEKGLPLLANGNDPQLQALARKDLEAPLDADARTALADGWWDLSEKEQGVAKRNLQKRAVRWYQRALPSLSGLPQVRVEKRLADYRKALAEAGLASARPSDAFFFAGRYYKVFLQDRVSWSGARDACARMGGRLACLETDEKQQFLAKHKGDKVVWVGGYFGTNKKWQWVSGEPLAPKRVGAQAIGHYYVAYGQRAGLHGRPDSGLVKTFKPPYVQGYICEWEE